MTGGTLLQDTRPEGILPAGRPLRSILAEVANLYFGLDAATETCSMRLSDVADSRAGALRELLALQGKTAPMDLKTCGALTIGALSWSVFYPLLAVHHATAGDRIQLELSQITVDTTLHISDDDPDAHRWLELRAFPDGGEVYDATLDDVELHDLYISLMRPIISHLSSTTGLNASAHWRLAADMVALCFITMSTQVRDPEAFIARGQRFLSLPGSELNNGKSGFMFIDVVDDVTHEVLAARWFLRRGGCCRIYTSEGKGYCNACVLRKLPEREEIFRSQLREELREAAA